MSLTFKNRIALFYMTATALTIAIVFVVIYYVVSSAVYSNIDLAVEYEAKKHLGDIEITNDSLWFKSDTVWEEREHKEAEVIPFFLQLVNSKGTLLDKSLNLKEQELVFNSEKLEGNLFNSILNQKYIRQIQMPIIFNNNVIGYLITAVSLEDSILVMNKLRNVLFVLFPIVLVFLFIIARYLAGKSIEPVMRITETTRLITRNNLTERIKLPEIKDELYTLTSSINELLDRMLNAFEREKQFTTDASHELRTPLSIIKGTLEVLVRKPRTELEYKEKVNYCISEIDSMSSRVDQLLLLARFDKSNIKLHKQNITALSLIDNIIQRHRKFIQENKIKIVIKDDYQPEIETDPYYADMILDNIIYNALKYSYRDGEVLIEIIHEGDNILIKIIDKGIGIKNEDLTAIFNPFFRSDALNHKQISGSGLGLSIVKKACEVLNVDVNIESKLGEGVKVKLKF